MLRSVVLAEVQEPPMPVGCPGCVCHSPATVVIARYLRPIIALPAQRVERPRMASSRQEGT
jgi:hypothetical protein